MTAAELNPELRNLIDARLDSVDRMLICAQIGWSERRSIVGEVETQIFELLARRALAPTRDDVLAVLDSLDPPESYVPEELRAKTAADAESSLLKSPNLSQRTVRLLAHYGRGALCAAALLLINGIVVLFIALSEGVIPWLITLGCLAWLNYSAICRFREWASHRPGHVLDDLRQAVAEWLIPKQGAQTT